MTTIALTLPDALAHRLRDQLAAESGASLESDVLDLIAADQQRLALDDLEAKILAGMEGPSTILDEAEWTRMRQEARARVAERALPS